MDKNLKSRKEFLSEVNTFLDEAFLFTKELGLNTDDLEIDHLCMRIKSNSTTDSIVEEISQNSIDNTHISCADINGRKIYIFKLKNPIKHGNKFIPCIEVPYPSTNHNFPYDNREHLEFVINCDAQTKENFEKVFLKHFGIEKNNLEYEIDLPEAKDSNQLPNPTISIQKYRGLKIKFHPKGIEKIVSQN